MSAGEAADAESRTWTTERLAARPPVPADGAAVLALHRDPRTVAHNPGDRLADLGAAEQLLRRWVQHWQDHQIGYWVLTWRHGDGHVIGVCGVKRMTSADRPVWNLLYRLEPSVWGRGVATEAAATVVDRARHHPLGLPVTARVRPANHASARVALAAGLERTPRLDTCGEDGPDEVYLVGPTRPAR
ncbi:GNAT family protein [Pseudokineococcus basanitobsidens]|uniref:GNAT family protein n=1 Tax=Pseudokineococcus basanitobsidens TaxID=1926649 RepID=A0ABU8RMQ1_9ACTN